MKAFLYGVSLQWKMDIRSKTLLITCYIVPLLFFVVMGGIFTSVMPDSKYADSIYDSIWSDDGCIDRFAAFSCGDLRK